MVDTSNMSEAGAGQITDIAKSMEQSQAFQAQLMIMQNDHQTIMQSYQAQKKMYEQIRA